MSNGGAGARNLFGLAWSRTGHEFYHQSGDQIMAVSYTVQGDTFVQQKARVWISKLGGGQWGLAPEGKRVGDHAGGLKARRPSRTTLSFFCKIFWITSSGNCRCTNDAGDDEPRAPVNVSDATRSSRPSAQAAWATSVITCGAASRFTTLRNTAVGCTRP